MELHHQAFMVKGDGKEDEEWDDDYRPTHHIPSPLITA